MSDTLTPQQVLLDAADLLETVGWQRGRYGDSVNGYCAMGAISQAVWGDPVGPKDIFGADYWSKADVQREAIALLKKKAIKRRYRWATVVDWNDSQAPDRGDYVIKTFRKAAK